MATKVAGHFRVSTLLQAGEDHASFATQRAAADRICELYKLEMTHVIEYSDTSGASVVLTPEIQRLIPAHDVWSNPGVTASRHDSVEDALRVALFGTGFIFPLSSRGGAAFSAVFPVRQASVSGLVDAIQKVGGERERDALFHKLRMALTSGKDDEALESARELPGVEVRHEESY
jgi:hypothetical protein